jgi:glycosyltransferase involved in cell wall biosynthesis
MKVGVWIDNEIKPQEGGGYSYFSSIVDLIDKHDFDEKLEIVFLTYDDFKVQLNKDIIILNPNVIRLSFINRLFSDLFKKTPILRRFSQKLKKELKRNRDEFVKRKLKEYNIDVIYYLRPYQFEIEDFPFITTHWDIGHKSLMAFPEIINNSSYTVRDEWYKNIVPKALSIFSESKAGKKELIRYFRFLENKIYVVPIFPGDIVFYEVSEEEQDAVLNKIGIKSGKYFFYPAQFWAHKNHYNLIIAFKQFIEKNPEYKLIFTGSDKGNLSYIKKIITQQKLDETVIILGFVENSYLYTLYKRATALVMPTFLGPTNMPPLEARELNCPVLCSKIEGHIEMLGKGAKYFNPYSISEIHESLEFATNQENLESLIDFAINERKQSNFKQSATIIAIENNLLSIAIVRNCWE